MTGAQYYRNKGHLEGLQEGIEKGIEEGIEKGIEKGIEEGIEKGQLVERRRLMLRLLEQRFGSLSTDTRNAIDAADYEVLGAWLDRIFQINDPSEL